MLLRAALEKWRGRAWVETLPEQDEDSRKLRGQAISSSPENSEPELGHVENWEAAASSASVRPST